MLIAVPEVIAGKKVAGLFTVEPEVALTEATAGPAEQTPAQKIFFWAGLVVAIVVAVFVTRIARRALREAAKPRLVRRGAGGVCMAGRTRVEDAPLRQPCPAIPA